MADPTSAPVVLFVHNRPATTSRVMERIRSARPPVLVVVADGPRPGDDAATGAARAVTETVDWPCRVVREYADVNLGIKTRVETGLGAVFAEFDRAIVLEDDCVPHPSFFGFCGALLDRYRDDERVMSISGSRLTAALDSPAASYAYSRYPLVWGWATWRRAWRHYDSRMSAWPDWRRRGRLETELDSSGAARYWAHVFEQNWLAGTGGNWDFAWVLSCWCRGGLSVLPAVNLVSNIGFGAGGTHTVDQRSIFNSMPTDALWGPLQHPVQLARDADEDAAIESVVFSGNLDRALTTIRERLRERRLVTTAGADPGRP